MKAAIHTGILPEPHLSPRLYANADGIWVKTTFGDELTLRKLMVSDGTTDEVEATLVEVEAAITSLGEAEPKWNSDMTTVSPAWPSHFSRPITYTCNHYGGTLVIPPDASTGASAELKLQMNYKGMRDSLRSLRDVLTSMKFIRHVSDPRIPEINVETTPISKKELRLTATFGGTNVSHDLPSTEDEEGREVITSYITRFEQLLSDHANPLIQTTGGWVHDSDDTIAYVKKSRMLRIYGPRHGSAVGYTTYFVEPQVLEKAYITAIEFLKTFLAAP